MTDAALIIPGVIHVAIDASAKGSGALVQIGPAVGWTMSRGVNTWTRELSVVAKEDLTPETTFRVVRYWSEVVGREVSVKTSNIGGGCGFPFEAGKRYLVFAARDENGALHALVDTVGDVTQVAQHSVHDRIVE